MRQTRRSVNGTRKKWDIFLLQFGCDTGHDICRLFFFMASKGVLVNLIRKEIWVRHALGILQLAYLTLPGFGLAVTSLCLELYHPWHL